MEITMVNVQKLQRAFDASWKRVESGDRPESILHTVRGPLFASDFWTCYMNSLDCLLVDREDLLENFDEMVNFGKSVKENVCLRNPCNEGDFILVPKDLAEKVLVLGALA